MFPDYKAPNDENSQGNLMQEYFSDKDLKAGDRINIRLYGISRRYYDYFRKLLAASGDGFWPISNNTRFGERKYHQSDPFRKLRVWIFQIIGSGCKGLYDKVINGGHRQCNSLWITIIYDAGVSNHATLTEERTGFLPGRKPVQFLTGNTCCLFVLDKSRISDFHYGVIFPPFRELPCKAVPLLQPHQRETERGQYGYSTVPFARFTGRYKFIFKIHSGNCIPYYNGRIQAGYGIRKIIVAKHICCIYLLQMFFLQVLVIHQFW